MIFVNVNGELSYLPLSFLYVCGVGEWGLRWWHGGSLGGGNGMDNGKFVHTKHNIISEISRLQENGYIW